MLSEPIKEGEEGPSASGCLISAGKVKFREVLGVSASAWQTSCTCWKTSEREREDGDENQSSWMGDTREEMGVREAGVRKERKKMCY